MINDPIVGEIRRIRQKYAEQFNNDLHAICEDLRRQERESDREFRSPSEKNADRSSESTSADGPPA
jgi:hypothetical protein